MNTIASMATTETRGSRTSQDQDALLQASRRVDWRFLLPAPELEATAYVGRVDPGLMDSLQQFTTSLTVFEPGQSTVWHTSRFAVVVASNPNRNELRDAVELARVGGFVYVEVDKRRLRQNRKRRSRDTRSPRGVAGYVSFLQQFRLSEPQVYWHWPSFDACNEIIPLHDRAAGVCALGRRGSSVGARWKRRLARFLLETRLLARIVPCFSVIARRSS